MSRGLTLTAVLLMLAPPAALAQTRERVKVTGVRLGLPFGAGAAVGVRGGAFKAGQWAPVYVDLECVRDTEENLLLVVETRDADDAITEGSVELGPMKKGDRLMGNELGRIPYLKPGGAYGGAGVSVRIKGAESGRTYGELTERSFTGVDTATFLILGVGTNLNGLRFPGMEKAEENNNSPATRGGWVQAAQVLDVGHLPDQWFGYGAVDLMVLGTGPDRAFWETLAAQQHEKRRKALAEWVRRGGRVVVSVGANPDVLDSMKELRDLLPANVLPGGKRSVKALPFTWTAPGAVSERNGLIGSPAAAQEFAVNTLQPRPDRVAKTILAEDSEGKQPLAVQGPYGMGRVTVMAFDIDRAPVADWPKRAQFWENLTTQAGYLLPGQKKETSYNSRSDEFTANLQGSLDFFEGVPVISFGWVALFILIYIVLIGPVDYLFLKKVVRRLEWTWVTFPVIVITVSAGAYFAAYALKGKDLKVNKVDVVDVDLIGRRVEGNTWFTLFSPRIQNYTIGLEPAGPADGGTSPWTPAAPTDAARNTVLSWQGSVDRYRGGGGGGLFSKRYKYQSTIDPADPNRDLYATGLEGVPIQVWTSKAFHAQWAAPLDAAKPPVAGELRVNPAAPDILIGSLTNNLPVDQFSDVVLFYRGKAFILPNQWPTGAERPVSASVAAGVEGSATVVDMKAWLTDPSRYPPGVPAWQPQGRGYNSGNTTGTPSNPNFRLWPVLFSDVAAETDRMNTPNASLRKLDQSWRVGLDRPEQAVLVMRMQTREGPAEDMTRAADNPTRLWLGDLPTGGGQRPAVQGTLKQETYVRVFIPVQQGPAKK